VWYPGQDLKYVCRPHKTARVPAMKHGRETMGGVVTFSKDIIEEKWKKNEENSNSDTPPLPTIIA
jgi:hypothetical protein